MRADGDKEESGLEIALPRSSPQIFFLMVVFLVVKTMAKAACRAFAEKLLKVVYVNIGAM